jgi:hypothetical protein
MLGEEANTVAALQVSVSELGGPPFLACVFADAEPFRHAIETRRRRFSE